MKSKECQKTSERCGHKERRKDIEGIGMRKMKKLMRARTLTKRNEGSGKSMDS